MINMDASARGWLYKEAKRQYWRVAAWYDLDDLIQDGCLHYCRINQKYGHVKDKPQLMSLFKITFINHCHDLSKKKCPELYRGGPREQMEHTVTALSKDDKSEQTIMNYLGFEGTQLVELALLLRDAPKPVLEVLKLLADEGSRRVLCATYRRRRNGTRETPNERLCRLTGYDPSAIDLAGAVRSYLSV